MLIRRTGRQGPHWFSDASSLNGDSNASLVNPALKKHLQFAKASHTLIHIHVSASRFFKLVLVQKRHKLTFTHE